MKLASGYFISRFIFKAELCRMAQAILICETNNKYRANSKLVTLFSFSKRPFSGWLQAILIRNLYSFNDIYCKKLKSFISSPFYLKFAPRHQAK